MSVASRIATLDKTGSTVWHHFTPLSKRAGAVNLGQGFPTFKGPSYLLDAAKEALTSQPLTQYTRSQGHPRLVEALAKRYESRFERERQQAGQISSSASSTVVSSSTPNSRSSRPHSTSSFSTGPVNAMENCIVTTGATDALLTAMLALVNQGDRVVLIEPFYDSYPAQVRIAGGEPAFVPLRPPTTSAATEGNSSRDTLSTAEWTLDLDALEAQLRRDDTHVMVLNNPQNIPGKVYSRAELEEIAALCCNHNITVICDEVYDALVWDEAGHASLATLPGMADRTVTIGSAGKSFSVTGFKIGWAIGHKSLIDAMQTIHQYVPFCTTTFAQEAVAVGFERADAEGYWGDMHDMFERKRQYTIDMLRSVNLEPVVPQGAYFMLADISSVESSLYRSDEAGTGEESEEGVEGSHGDWQFCDWLTQHVGVTAIPVSPCVSENRELYKGFVRFSFCKTDDELSSARDRLQPWKDKFGGT